MVFNDVFELIRKDIIRIYSNCYLFIGFYFVVLIFLFNYRILKYINLIWMLFLVLNIEFVIVIWCDDECNDEDICE